MPVPVFPISTDHLSFRDFLAVREPARYPAPATRLTDSLRRLNLDSPPPSPNGSYLRAPYSRSLSWLDDHKVPFDLEKLVTRSTSSIGSDSDDDGRLTSYEAFCDARSRVIRFFDLQCSTSAALSVFSGASSSGHPVPRPAALWASKSVREPGSLFAVYATHEEARTALFSPCYSFSVAPALESDIQPPFQLRRVDLNNLISPARENFDSSSDISRQKPLCDIPSTYIGIGPPCIDLTFLRMGGRDTSDPLLHSAAVGPYTISSNPPNPKTSFRLGDWICTVASCAAHNFGRNVSCIGCGRSRSEGPSSLTQHRSASLDFSQVNHMSPRFSSPSVPRDQLSRPPFPRIMTSNLPPVNPAPTSAPPIPSLKSASPYTPLTPSGRALSIGGHVQNVSKDPLAPCIIYWPDNEALPEQGQIRPSGSAVITYPPIINTGNKGAAEKQPGDWICHKCHYLNWRRRKVCQTCFPYAEGNGDSISAAVQAERIALLESVLANQAQACGGAHAHPHERWHSVDSPARAPAAPYSEAEVPPYLRIVPRGDSLPSYELFNAGDSPSRPIYQTHGRPVGGARPFPFACAPPFPPGADAEQSMTLLPSFLQDIVQSPSLSPTTTSSSAELSLEDSVAPLQPTPRAYNAGATGFGLRRGSIWKLDGEESRHLAVYSASTSSASSPAGPGREGGRSR